MSKIVVIRYLLDTNKEKKYVEYYDDKRVKIIKYHRFISRYGDNFTDIPENTILTKKEKDESLRKQHTSETSLKTKE